MVVVSLPDWTFSPEVKLSTPWLFQGTSQGWTDFDSGEATCCKQNQKNQVLATLSHSLSATLGHPRSRVRNPLTATLLVANSVTNSVAYMLTVLLAVLATLSHHGGGQSRTGLFSGPFGWLPDLIGKEDQVKLSGNEV